MKKTILNYHAVFYRISLYFATVYFKSQNTNQKLDPVSQRTAFSNQYAIRVYALCFMLRAFRITI